MNSGSDSHSDSSRAARLSGAPSNESTSLNDRRADDDVQEERHYNLIQGFQTLRPLLELDPNGEHLRTSTGDRLPPEQFNALRFLITGDFSLLPSSSSESEDNNNNSSSEDDNNEPVREEVETLQRRPIATLQVRPLREQQVHEPTPLPSVPAPIRRRTFP